MSLWLKVSFETFRNIVQELTGPKLGVSSSGKEPGMIQKFWILVSVCEAELCDYGQIS